MEVLPQVVGGINNQQQTPCRACDHHKSRCCTRATFLDTSFQERFDCMSMHTLIECSATLHFGEDMLHAASKAAESNYKG